MDASSFTAFDIGVGVIVLISALLAWARGLTREVLGLIAWAAAALGAYFFWTEAQARMMEATGNEYAALVLTFLVTFVLPLVIGKIIAGAIAKRVDASGGGGVDRLLGLIFGAARGLVVIAVLFWAADRMIQREEHPAWVTGAISYPHVARAADWLGELIPEQITEQTEDTAAGAARLGDLIAPSQGAADDGGSGSP